MVQVLTASRPFRLSEPAPALIELIYEHYHQFEPRYQMLLPLKRSYIPGPIG